MRKAPRRVPRRSRCAPSAQYPSDALRPSMLLLAGIRRVPARWEAAEGENGGSGGVRSDKREARASILKKSARTQRPISIQRALRLRGPSGGNATSTSKVGNSNEGRNGGGGGARSGAHHAPGSILNESTHTQRPESLQRALRQHGPSGGNPTSTRKVGNSKKGRNDGSGGGRSDAQGAPGRYAEQVHAHSAPEIPPTRIAPTWCFRRESDEYQQSGEQQ